MLRRIKLGFSLLLLAALIVYVLQNLGAVELHFLGWKTSMSLAAPTLLAYLIGGITARPLLRMLNSQRKDKKLRAKAQREAEKDRDKQKLADAQNKVRR